MNLYTYMVSILKSTQTNHYAKIVETLDSMLRDVDELMEDPLFIENIHGEQELSLDQAVDLLNGIRLNFLPRIKPPKISPAHESGMIDVS